MTFERAVAGNDVGRRRRRDAALRRTRLVIVGVAAGATGLSGALSVVAAQAFKGHAQSSTAPATRTEQRTPRVDVPGPQAVPPIAGDPAPLQPPSQPPAAAAPAPAAPAPQVSGGS